MDQDGTATGHESNHENTKILEEHEEDRGFFFVTFETFWLRGRLLCDRF